MKDIFYFGEKLKEFNVRVLNEREVRASAGILFLFAGISFMNSWFSGNFYFTKMFVVLFLIDFSIRIFVNPKYSPSLILGRFFVRNQKPEYVGAPQKRFAWTIGFVLAMTMFFVLVLGSVIGPFNLFICLTCLILLFFESAFGICLGCKIYNLFNKKKAELCPGGTCDSLKKEKIQNINVVQILILFGFIVVAFSLPSLKFIQPDNSTSAKVVETEVVDKTEETTDEVDDPCVVPDWAKKLGHEEQYKLHHGCDE